MRNLLIAAWLAALSTAALALEIIPLNWRDAAEVAAALRPQLQAGEKVSALDQQLILDAAPQRSAALRQLVRQLDQRPASLQLEVSQDSSTQQRQSGVQLGGRDPHSGLQLDSSQALTPRPGAQLTLSAQARQNSSQTLQTLRLLDGKTGFIQIDNSQPLPFLLLQANGQPVVGVTYQDAITGFYLQPRLAGQRVSLVLAVSEQAFDGAALRGSQLSTVVEGRLGEWITVGSVGLDQQGRERILIGASRSDFSSQRLLRVRVSNAR